MQAIKFFELTRRNLMQLIWKNEIIHRIESLNSLDFASIVIYTLRIFSFKMLKKARKYWVLDKKIRLC
jgi:hypothetical protein